MNIEFKYLSKYLRLNFVSTAYWLIGDPRHRWYWWPPRRPRAPQHKLNDVCAWWLLYFLLGWYMVCDNYKLRIWFWNPFTYLRLDFFKFAFNILAVAVQSASRVVLMWCILVESQCWYFSKLGQIIGIRKICSIGIYGWIEIKLTIFFWIQNWI